VTLEDGITVTGERNVPEECRYQTDRGGRLQSRIRQAIYVKRHTEERSRNHCCCGIAISVTYSKCVIVALVIQHEKSRAVFYCHLWPLRLYNIIPCFAISHKWQYFGEKKGFFKHKLCVLLFYTTFKIFLIRRRLQRYSGINVHRPSCSVSVILVGF